ncbi:hypothetical protein [Pseudomonas syringae]|uniref:hypothetical protein n=1 Tax=Pseudomonas syringae TaxID=317 RepID=UPI000E329673|nr:hypothetical protein [Pseudomonas syringae]
MKTGMKISDLQAWLEEQKALHGDIGVVCMTAFGSVAEGEALTRDELSVSTPGMLGLLRDGLDEDKTVVAIGYGSDF